MQQCDAEEFILSPSMLYSFDINSIQSYEIQLEQPLSNIKPTTIIKSHPPQPKPDDFRLVPLGLLLRELPMFEDKCTGGALVYVT